MAYAASGSGAPVVEIIGGRRYYFWEVVETEATTTSEYQITKVPIAGKIVLVQHTHVSGSGSTCRPSLRYATGAIDSSNDDVYQNASAAANDIDEPARPYYQSAATKRLFVRSNVDSGSDNTIHTRIIISESVS